MVKKWGGRVRIGSIELEVKDLLKDENIRFGKRDLGGKTPGS